MLTVIGNNFEAWLISFLEFNYLIDAGAHIQRPDLWRWKPLGIRS